MCLSLTLQKVYGNEFVGRANDPVDSNIDACTDILSAWIEQKGGNLTFFMEMRGDIPTVLAKPNDSITFIWFVDADKSSSTGQPHGGVGSEFNVRAVVGETFGGGFVDVCGSIPGGGRGQVTIQGNRISMSIGIPQIGQPSDFNWRCKTFQQINGARVSGNRETGINITKLLEYSVPARVTLTPPLLMLSPNGPDVGYLQLDIYDEQDNLLPHEEHQIIWSSSNEAVATVSDSGEVKVHGVPSAFWETPYINVSVDGITADNSVIVRSTNMDLGLSHQMFDGEYVAFYLPAMIEDVNLVNITLDYQIVAATDLAYKVQMKGVGTTPYQTGLQYFILDVTDDPNTVPCGLSGNPIRLGWEYGKPIHNSCYIVNVPENQTPQWGVIFHELGHNFTYKSRSFAEFVNAANSDQRFTYSEGLATLGRMWSYYCILNYNAGLILFSHTKDSIETDCSNKRELHLRNLRDYQNNGSKYSEINPHVLDGILYEIYDLYGPKVWFDIFSTFLPADESLPYKLNTEAQQATWLVAAISVSTGENLREVFRNSYGFPIDDDAWLEIYGCVEERIWERDWPGFVEEDFENNDFSALEWSFSGDAGWIISTQAYSGKYCAQAGPIGNNETSTLSLSLNCIEDDISFYCKVSSERNFDYLKFYIDGAEQGRWSGDQDWIQVSFPVGAGTRTFKWTYSKDSSFSKGEDAAWIDDIKWVAIPVPPYE
jgi:hypothetical protein